MKTITLKKLRLLNFKGVRDQEIQFSHNTTIEGHNGTGKSTIADAFWWLLFGKNSSGDEKFEIKTLDKDNNVIWKLPHEVEGTLDVDGQEITLKRCYSEKWETKRGTSEEKFTGHTVDLFYNEVPCSASEFKQKISEICGEELFKLITNPYYFNSLKNEQKRKIISELAGEVKDEQIATGNKEFEKLLQDLTGKTIEEYKKEIAAKSKSVKEELERIPIAIDEVQRGMPVPLSWERIEKQIEGKKLELKAIATQITDKAKASSEIQNERLEFQQKINNLKEERARLEFSKREELLKDFSIEKERQLGIIHSIREKESRLDTIKESISNRESLIAKNQDYMDGLKLDYSNLIARKPEFNDEIFSCPTCKRPFDNEDIEAKKKELTDNFNIDRANKITEINAEGIIHKKDNERMQKEIDALKSEKETIDSDIADLKARRKDLEVPEVDLALKADKELQEMDSAIEELQKVLSIQPYEFDYSELTEQQTHLSAEITRLNVDLAQREEIKKDQKRIAELQTKQKAMAQALADLQKKEFTIVEFSKAKIEEIEKKINGLFLVVKFKMFELQINGGEKEICEATVDGVPFSSLNTASRLNAGIDIINALTKHHQISAPIFIDNRESVVEIIDCDSQIINLSVVKNKPLTIL